MKWIVRSVVVAAATATLLFPSTSAAFSWRHAARLPAACGGVNKLAPTPNGGVWVACYADRGRAVLVRFDRGGRIRQTQRIRVGAVRQLLVDRAGTVWWTSGSYGSPGRYVGSVTLSGRSRRYAPSGTLVHSAVISSEGRFWFATGKYIATFRRGGGIRRLAIPPDSSVRYAMSAGRDGTIWFGSRGTRHYRVVLATGTVTTFTGPPAGVATLVDPAGNAYFRPELRALNASFASRPRGR